MNQKKIGGTKKKVTDALAMLLMIIVFCAFSRLINTFNKSKMFLISWKNYWTICFTQLL